MLSGDELASQLGICTTTIHQWGRAGLLKRHLYGNSCCLYEPVANVVVVKGAGGRNVSKQPFFITAPISYTRCSTKPSPCRAAGAVVSAGSRYRNAPPSRRKCD